MTHPGPIDECIRRELGPHEHIIWAARPSPSAVFREHAYGLIFSSCWLLFLAPVVFEADVKEHAPMAGGIYLMLAFGVLMLVGTILQCLSAKRIQYALTEHRLIVAGNGRRSSVQSVRRDQIKSVERVGSNPDRGTILIPMGMVRDGDGGEKVEYLKLLGIPEPGKVFHLLTR